MKDLTDIWDASARYAQETFDAIQDELSGNGLSRQAKLGNHREEVKDRRGLGRKDRSMVDAALDYANAAARREALYQAAWDALTVAEAEAARMLLRLEDALTTETDHLNALRRSAATLPDGTKIFRAADGTILSEDGRDLTHLADHIEWTGNEPTWEEYKAQRDQVAEVTAQLAAWREYQIGVLGRARDRLSDPDNPPSAKELEEIRKRIIEDAPLPVTEAKPDAIASNDDLSTLRAVLGPGDQWR